MASIDDPTTWQQFGELDEEFCLVRTAASVYAQQ